MIGTAWYQRLAGIDQFCHHGHERPMTMAVMQANTASMASALTVGGTAP
jgi:hypothetical protein